MADIDWSQFLETSTTPLVPAAQPAVTPAPAAPTGGMDWSQFMERPEVAPLAQRVEPQFAPKMNAFTAALTGQRMPPTALQVDSTFVPGGAPAVPELPWGSGVIGRSARAGVMGGANLLMGPIVAMELAGRNLVGADMPESGPLAGYLARRDAMAQEAELAQGFESNIGKDIVGATVQSLSDPTMMLPASAAGQLAAKSVAPIAGMAGRGTAALNAGTTATGISTVAQDAAQAADDGQLTGQELSNSVLQGLIEQRFGRLGGQMGEMRGVAGGPMAGRVGEYVGDAAIREPLQEGATSLAQDTARAGVMEGRVLSGEEGLRSTAIGAGSGGLTSASINAPSLLTPGQAPAREPGILDGVIDRLAAEPAPEAPEPDASTSDQIDWDDETLEGPETREDNLRNRLFDEITDEEAQAINAELDNIENQAPEVEAPEVVPDEEVAAPARPRDIQDETETQVDLRTPTGYDQAQAASEDAKDDVQDKEPKPYAGPTPEPEVQESPEDRKWREAEERLTTKGILAPKNLPSKFAQGGFVTKEQAAERAAAPKVDATAPTEKFLKPVAPKSQETIDFDQPAPAQAVEAPTPAKPAAPMAPKGFPARGTLKGRKVERDFFGPMIERKAAPKGFTSQKAHVVKDGGVTDMDVKDMGQGLFVGHHPYSGSAMILAKTDAKGRRDPAGEFLRPLNARGEVESVDTAAGKGQKFPTVEDAVRFAGKNLVKAEVDTAASDAAGQEIANTSDARAGGELNVRKGQNIGVTRRAPEPAAAPSETPVSQTKERSRADKKARLAFLADRGQRGNLSDEELDEADALEAELAQAPEVEEAKKFKAVPGSPLTPKLRQNIADSVTPDMPARNVGIVVKNMLEAQLKRDATQAEVAAALRDLAENDIYGGGVAPGSSKEVHALNFMPLVKGLAKIAGVNPGGWLRERVAELSIDNQAFAEVEGSIKPGQFGYTPRQIAKWVTRSIGMRGKVGSWLVNAATQLSHVMTARMVSAWFPEFRPILRLAQKMIDQSRIKFQENFERLRLFRSQRAESKFQINGALVQFRLEDRDPVDFDKPVTYIDEQGRAHQFTLTPRQIGIVKLSHAASKNVLTDYVDVLKDVFSLPPSIVTVADLRKAIAAGTLPPSAKILEAPMQILETGKDNYVPLKRYGDQYHAIIYDAAKFAAARTRAQRKAAEIGFIKASSNADLNEQIANAGQKHPGSHIVAYEDAMAVNGDKSGVSAKDIVDLADIAGVPPVILQDFLDAGVGSYLETRGIGARFAESKNVPGFSHDMLHGIASHLQAMTQATERLRYRSKMEKLTKDLKDHELKRYAQRFMQHIDVPVGALAQGVRALTTLYYLGLGAVSAAVNSFTSLVVQPAGLFMATGNPSDAAKAFGIAVREQFNALTAIFGNGANPIGRVIGRGEDQIDMAISRARRQQNFRLADAIEGARDAGVFNNIFDREAESVAKHGEESGLSKVRDLASQGMMHFFAKVETANRLSAFIGAYGVHEQNSGSPGYDRYVNALGFSPGGSSAEFAEFFSDSNNFRGDQTDLPSWAHGKFVKDSSGKEVFASSTWRPMAYALKSYTVNYMAQQLTILKAAMTGGWIDKALYAGIATSFIVAFGAVNVFPGLSTLDKAVAAIEGGIETPLERIKDGGGVGRALSTGLPGQLASEYLDERLGETIDYMSSRAGSANVLPGGIKPTDLFAPLSVADAQARAIGNLVQGVRHGDAETALEGAGGLISKQGERTARAYNQLTGSRGYTTKDGATLVPSEETAVPGAPFMGLGDIASSFLGAQPPVVRDAYREKQMIRDMKTSNDAVMENAVNAIADGAIAKDKAKIAQAVQTVKDWNARALNNKEPWKVISGDAIMQAVTLEMQSRMLGARNLRPVPKFGRERYLQEFEEATPDENIKKKPVTEDEE